MEFYVSNGYQSWECLYSEIMNYLHGQKMRAYLEDDPGFYYEGRFSVNKWESNKYRSTIVIEYNVAPYKIDMIGTSEDWLWDNLDFEVGVIREYNDIQVNGEASLEIIGGRKTTIPEFIVTLTNPNNPIMLSWSKDTSKNYSLPNGKIRLPDIKIKNDVSTLYFSGSGIVTADYRGGSL